MGYYNSPSILNGVNKEKNKKKTGTGGAYAAAGAYSSTPSSGTNIKGTQNIPGEGVYKVNATPYSASGNTALYGTGVATPNKGTGAETKYSSHIAGGVSGASPSVVQKIDNGATTPTEPITPTSPTNVEKKPVTEETNTNTSPTEPKPMTYGEYIEYLDKRKEQAIKDAETERQRTVIDAQSAYQQNKATYGTNAEKLASMGLTGSGYGEYMDSQAYVQSRAEITDANARAQKAKETIESNYDETVLEASEQFAAKDEAAKEKHNSNFNAVLGLAKTSELTDDEIMNYAEVYGLSEEEVGIIKNATAQFVSDRTDAENESDTKEHNANFNTFLQLAQTSDLSEEELTKYGKMYGLTPEEIEMGRVATQGYRDDNHLNDYMGVLELATTTPLSEDMLKALQKQFNLTDEEMSSIRAENQKFMAKNEGEISSNLGDDIGTLESAKNTGTISKDYADKRIEEIQNENFKNFRNDMGNNPDLSEIDEAVKNNEITKEQYNTLKSEYNESVVTGKAAFQNDDYTMITKKEAEKLMKDAENAKSNGWITEDTYNEISKAYTKYYTVKTSDGVMLEPGTVDTEGELDNPGDDITVHDKNNKDFEVDSLGEVTDSHILEISEDVADEMLFLYDGELYVRRSKRLFKIGPRDGEAPNEDDDRYWKLLENFK